MARIVFPDGITRERSWIGPIALYVALVGALSWGWWLPIALTGGTVRRGDAWPTHVSGLLGPMIAAIVATALLGGRPGLRALGAGMARWRVGWRWWGVALSPLALAVASLPIVRVVDGAWPAWSDFGRFNGLPATGPVVMWLLITVLNGFGEETGWRGYLLPHLQRQLSPLAATAVVAAIWALWHLPTFFILASYQDFAPPMLLGFLVGLASGAVVLTWLYNRSGGSVLLVATWHGTYNLVSGTDGAEGMMQVVVSALVIALAIHLVVREIQSRRAGVPEVLGPAPRAAR